MIYKTPVQPRFNEADPAGIIFFANAYVLAHAAFEKFVTEELGFEWAEWFDNKAWGVPLRHTECEHLAPMRPGETYDIAVTVEKIGDSSVTLKYAFMGSRDSGTQTSHAVVTMVHTFIDVVKLAKMQVPSSVRDRLEAYQRKSATP